MRNLKFGAFFLGLVLVISALVSAVNAQGPDGRPSTRQRPQADADSLRARRGELFVLDGRGAQLGVMVSDVDVKSATGGAKVDEVNPDSPAEKAGIKAGDVVVEYDGEKVRSARQFTRLVQETPEGRSVSIALLRDGKRQTVNATPESGRMTWNFDREPGAGSRVPEFHMRELPEFNFDLRDLPRTFEYRMPERFPAPGSRFPGSSRGRLGVNVQSMSPELEEYFGVKNGGALVSSVTPDSAASRAGIKAGDVIVSVNGRSVADADDLIAKIDDVNGEATIVVVRDKKEVTLKATIERPRATMPRPGSRPGIL